MQESRLVEGRLFPTLIRFTLPFLLASLLQQLYSVVDLMIVGRFCDAASLSAVATGGQMVATLTYVIVGLTSGGTVLIGQYTGAKRDKDVVESIGTMFLLFSGIAIALTVVMLLATNSIVELLNAPAGAVEQTRTYLFTCCCGIFFITGYNMVSAMLRGLGDSKSPLIFISIACGLNIVLDLIFVGGFHMGVFGAAIATIAAQGISFILAIFYLKHRDFCFDFKRKSFRFLKDKAQSLLKLGAPIALQEGLVGVSFLLIISVVNNIGLVESASVGVVERIVTFTMLPSIAFMSSISAMAAQNMGAEQPLRAKRSMQFGILICLVISVIVAAAIWNGPEPVVGLFTEDPAVVKAGSLYLLTYVLDTVCVSFVFCLNGFFSGCGKTTFSMINCLISTFAIRVPLVFIVSQQPDITLFHIGMAAPIASAVQIVIQLCYLRSNRWQAKFLKD